MAPNIHIGTSGWSYRDWIGRFYPPGTKAGEMLPLYARRFGTVEVNATFYRRPRADMVARWHDVTPAGFVFAVKASRQITHVRRLANAEEALGDFLAGVAPLGDKLGPVLFQLPPSLGPDLPRLSAFLSTLPAELRPVIEFRDPAWHTEDTLSLMARHGAALCVHDYPGMAPMARATAPQAYLRFHGPGPGRYAGRYGTDGLEPWARRIAGWRDEGKEVFVYFNNDRDGAAVEDALALRAMLEGPGVD